MKKKDKDKRPMIAPPNILDCIIQGKLDFMEIMLPGEKKTRLRALMSVKMEYNKLEAFRRTFMLNATQLKIAQTVFREDKTYKDEYFIMIDNRLRIIFAFHGEFAKFDRDKKRIIFKDPDYILIEELNKQKTSNLEDILKDLLKERCGTPIVPIVDDFFRPLDPFDRVIMYGLPDRRRGGQVMMYGIFQPPEDKKPEKENNKK